MAEATVQGEILEERLLAALPTESRVRAAAWLAAARAEVAAEPARCGWVSAGRVSAFGDEDPFIAHNALLARIAAGVLNDPVAASLREAVRAAGFDTLDAFGEFTHREAVARIERARGPAILPEAAAAGRALLARGHELVVASNSPPEKLRRWFGHAGLPCTLHPARGRASIRVRGSARKYELSAMARDPLMLGELAVAVDRPIYDRILGEERPDAVVGDVFSLDLALPLHLRRNDPEFPGLELFWLIRPYTPEWLAREVAAHAPEVAPIEGGLTAVATRLSPA